jgi:subtilisin family serine protease
MTGMRVPIRFAGAAVTAAATVLAMVGAAPQAAFASGEQTEYTVLAAAGVDSATALAAIAQAGGQVVERNDAVGIFRVLAAETGFVEQVAAAPALAGAAHRTAIGRAPAVKPADVEQEGLAAALAGEASTAIGGRPGGPAPGMDPLDDKLWGLRMVRSDRARQINAGDRRVHVGVLDTGMDASHPDIAPNFDWNLSRNFAPDIPLVDGPCETAGCVDAVGTDDNGHGTHTSGTIGAAVNGFGVSGVAPGVSLVELKGGQDSGFFFLEPVVNALTYAGDAGVDVVNMSFFVDPWLYNCTANPADSPAQQAEQRVIIEGMSRALTYAHNHGVTLVNSLGNNHEDLGNPRVDRSSPDYPPDAPTVPRTIDNATCLDLPVEGPFVIGVSALGPSGTKADYSNYGLEQISVSAPGGWFRDGFGTPTFRSVGNQILSSFPLKPLQESGLVDAAGNITPSGAGSVFKECTAAGSCGYFTYLQGTSMASPHAVGVAALVVSRFGEQDPDHPGTLRLAPWKTESMLLHTAAEHSCPAVQSYVREGRSTEFDAPCPGDLNFNALYGYGIVDAYAVVTEPPAWGVNP